MRHFASLLSRPVWLALPVALLTLVGGATAAAAAVPAAAVAAGAVPAAAAPAVARSAVFAPGPAYTAKPLLWHTLALEHGWASASTKPNPVGTPAWATRAGVVYLRGAIKQTTDGGTVFAQLPQSAWPTHATYLTVSTAAHVPGTLFVGPDGVTEAYNGLADTFTSLAGVSYLTTTVKTSSLTLENGWRSGQPDYGTGDPGYGVVDGVVHLTGSMYVSGNARLAFMLPKAARPAAGMYTLTYTLDGSTGWLHIQSTGQVYANGRQATGYTSLAGIAFPVRGTKWTKFTLRDHWKSAALLFHTAPPEYAVVDDVVYLTGSMHQPVSATGSWASLPAAARTTGSVLDIEVATAKGSAGAASMTKSWGSVSSTPSGNARAFTSLAGIGYPPGS
jgi:hypothetical protein